MKFEIKLGAGTFMFNSETRGLIVNREEFVSEEDGILIYDKIKGIKSKKVELQMSTNTSTLIPAFRILDIHYNKYFDESDVIKSQNDITFYWNKSKLAAFYNRFSTDDIPFGEREPIIRKAVDFIIGSFKKLPLKEEYLKKVLEPCKLLGFYKGFPIFDSSTGFAKLQSRLGIHVGSETVMVSTPMDKYGNDVYELANTIYKEVGEGFSKKKNRVVFEKTKKLLKFFNIL